MTKTRDIADLANGIDASELSFTTSGGGAVERTIESKLRDVVSVKDFGAVGDFSEDSSPALLAAIEAVNANGGGGVFIPAGVYQVASQIDLSSVGTISNVTIFGEGSGSIFKFANNYNGNSQRWIYDQTNTHENIILRDFAFDGNEANMGNAEVTRDKIIKLICNNFVLTNTHFYNEAGRGVITVTGDNLLFESNRFTRIGSRTGSGVYASDSSSLHPGQAASPASNVIVSNNIHEGSADNNTRHSFIDAIISRNGVFTNNTSYGGNQGLLLTTDSADCTGITIANNVFYDRSRAIHVYTTGAPSTGSISNVLISNNYCKGANGIRVNGSNNDTTPSAVFDNFKLVNNIVTLTDFGGVGGSSSGITCDYVNALDLGQNTASGFLGNGLDITNSANVTISCNTLYENNQHGLLVQTISGLKCFGNSIYNNGRSTDNTYSGIRISDFTTDFTIDGNKIGETDSLAAVRQAYGISLSDSANSSNGRIAGNYLYNNKTANFLDSVANISNLRVLNNAGFNDVSTTPSQITSSQNSFNGGRHSDVWRISSDAARSIRGVNASGPYDTRKIQLINVGGFDITLNNEHASATTAEMRIITGTGADLVLNPNEYATLIYDGTSARWRVVATNA